MIVLPEFMCIHTYISPPLSVYVCATSFYAVAAKGRSPDSHRPSRHRRDSDLSRDSERLG